MVPSECLERYSEGCRGEAFSLKPYHYQIPFAVVRSCLFSRDVPAPKVAACLRLAGHHLQVGNYSYRYTEIFFRDVVASLGRRLRPQRFLETFPEFICGLLDRFAKQESLNVQGLLSVLQLLCEAKSLMGDRCFSQSEEVQSRLMQLAQKPYRFEHLRRTLCYEDPSVQIKGLMDNALQLYRRLVCLDFWTEHLAGYGKRPEAFLQLMLIVGLMRSAGEEELRADQIKQERSRRAIKGAFRLLAHNRGFLDPKMCSKIARDEALQLICDAYNKLPERSLFRCLMGAALQETRGFSSRCEKLWGPALRELLRPVETSHAMEYVQVMVRWMRLGGFSWGKERQYGALSLFTGRLIWSLRFHPVVDLTAPLLGRFGSTDEERRYILVNLIYILMDGETGSAAVLEVLKLYPDIRSLIWELGAVKARLWRHAKREEERECLSRAMLAALKELKCQALSDEEKKELNEQISHVCLLQKLEARRRNACSSEISGSSGALS